MLDLSGPTNYVNLRLLFENIEVGSDSRPNDRNKPNANINRIAQQYMGKRRTLSGHSYFSCLCYREVSPTFSTVGGRYSISQAERGEQGDRQACHTAKKAIIIAFSDVGYRE